MQRTLAIVFTLFALAAQAEIYRCESSDGRIAFSETPCQEGLVEKVELKSPAVISSRTFSVPTENLLKNGDFENGTVGWSLATETALYPGEGTANSAAVGLQVSKKEKDRYGQETAVSQCTALNNGASYVLSADVYLKGIPEKNHANRIHLIWYSSEDCSTGGQWAHYLEPKPVSSWQHLQSKTLTPSLGARAAKIRIVQVGKYARGGKTLWDNVALVSSGEAQQKTLPHTFIDAPPGTNLIKNGDFAQNLDNWYRGALSWDANTGRNAKGSARASLHSKRGGLGTGVGSQCVKLAKGRVYELSAWVMKDLKSTQEGGGRLRITWYGDTQCRQAGKTSVYHADFEDKSGWQFLSVPDLHAPQSAGSARVELIQSIKGTGVFAVYWDDLALTLIEH